MSWAILTGEYPPSIGGVAEHARLVARALRAAGDEVHVFTPRGSDEEVHVHEVRGFASGVDLSLVPEPRRILVEWVPHAFGWKSANVGFVAWLSRQENVTAIFHEVALPRAGPLRHRVLARVHEAMARTIARSARVFVTTTAWERFFSRPVGWLPNPSSLPTDVPRVVEPGLVGHFGTYGKLVRPLLSASLEEILRDPATRCVLLGAAGKDFLQEGSERVTAPGAQEPRELAGVLSRCELVVQPFPDGVTTRRSSVMAALALGVPVVTNEGDLTEDVWRAGAVALAKDASSVGKLARELKGTPELAAIGERGRALYRERFALEHLVRALRS